MYQWDHPRMGGEKSIATAKPQTFGGSPPHGRGKELGGVVCQLGGGITPAWAGKSGYTYTGCNSYEDHPRMGGEK